MNKSANDMMWVGSAVMTMGAVVAAAVCLGKRDSSKRKIKKLAKKSAKAVDGITDNISCLFK